MADNDSRPLASIARRSLLTSAMLGAGTTILPLRAVAAAAPASPEAEAASRLTVQTTEGPYYLALDLVRADITEGKMGIPLDIAFTVIDQTGHPATGSMVDIWHCDAQGVYSGFTEPGPGPAAPIQSKTFLRGTQQVGAEGKVVFSSIYPGWYHGRTTHIHFKVKTGALTNLTSQFFLPDTLSEFLYTQVPDYRRTELRDTLNSDDGIAIEAGESVAGNVRESRGRYVAALTVRVDRNANPPIDRPPVPGGPPPADKHFGPPSGDRRGPLPGMATSPLTSEARTAALLPNAERHAEPFGPPKGPLPG